MSKKQYDVVALGELLIDFIGAGDSEFGNPLYEANPGGAPCNVLAMLQKLGKKTAFIGKVGNDGFGKQLTEEVSSCGVDLSGLMHDQKIHTTLAFVHKLPNGDRDFSFYRQPGADMMLTEDEINEELIRSAKIFHFGSLSLTDEPVRSATQKALRIAEDAGVLRSYDPNLRMPLWNSEELAREQILWGMAHCDMLKIADNEITWLTGKEDYDEGIHELQERFHIPLICLTLGPDGCRVYYKGKQMNIPGYRQANTIETTGAGDTFCACMINAVLEHGLDGFNAETLKKCAQFACAAASIITTRKGALKSMPEKEEVVSFLRTVE